MRNDYYVYIHFRKDNLQPFYVGKGNRNRFKEKSKRNKYWHSIINKYGLFPQIMEKNLTEEQAFDREKFYIKVLGRENLCNFTDGGEGNSGYKHTEEFKQKASQNKKGKNNPNFGKSTAHYNPHSIKIEIDGVIFNSKNEASRKLNIPLTTICRRLKSDKYKQYKLNYALL